MRNIRRVSEAEEKDRLGETLVLEPLPLAVGHEATPAGRHQQAAAVSLLPATETSVDTNAERSNYGLNLQDIGQGIGNLAGAPLFTGVDGLGGITMPQDLFGTQSGDQGHDNTGSEGETVEPGGIVLPPIDS